MNWEKQHKALGGSLVIDWNGLTGRFHEYAANGKNGKSRKYTTDSFAKSDHKPSAEREPAVSQHSA
jgi:hypothetical protein